MLRPANVTVLQYTALTVLERRSGLRTAELASNAFVTDLSAADMVSVLEGRGLVQRTADPADRRRRVLGLTDDGRSLLARLREQVSAVEERMLSPLAADEAQHLRRYLVDCRGALASAPPH